MRKLLMSKFHSVSHCSGLRGRLCAIVLGCCVGLASDVTMAMQTQEVTAKDKMVVEAITRLQNFDIESSPPAKAALLRFLQADFGSEQGLALIERFKLIELSDQLAEFAVKHPNDTAGVRAAAILFSFDKQSLLQQRIGSENQEEAIAAVKLIGRSGGKQCLPLLMPLINDNAQPMALRVAALTAIGHRIDAQRRILKKVVAKDLPKELEFAAANALLSSRDDAIRKSAGEHLQLPATADSQPLPTIAELVKRKGDAGLGKTLFATTGTCIQCHKVKGTGKEVGPDLSEIGSKLSREAMYVSILDPSAAVSHNFETYTVVTDAGDAVTGLLISETDDSTTLRTAEGIDRKFAADEIELFQKQPNSIMPQDLQRLLTVQQLVDIVEYTMTLQK